MSNRHLKIGNRKRKGISPVIATVMLVAVAVVIAAALAGFSGSLFGSYSSGPQVKVQSMALGADGAGSVTLSNNGSADDAVIAVQVTGVGSIVLTSDNVVPANSLPNPVYFDLANDTETPFDTDNLTSGQQVTAVISLASGATITQTITVVQTGPVAPTP